jgi:putative Ca2+/H+ antiporter (TMEM165/GDT1 family)
MFRRHLASLSHTNIPICAGVTLGAVVGHALCTGAAVIGGELLALKISQRTVAVSGGTLFILFALHNLLSKD